MSDNKPHAANVAADAASGLLEPFVRKIGQWLAEKVPADSPLRSEFSESALGAVKQVVEGFADKLPTPLAKILERLTDVGDAFTFSLATDREGHAPAWASKWLADAMKRISAAKEASDLETVKARLVMEFALLQELEKLAEGKHHESDGDHHDNRSKPFWIQYETARNAWSADLDEREKKQQESEAGLVEDILDFFLLGDAYRRRRERKKAEEKLLRAEREAWEAQEAAKAQQEENDDAEQPLA